MDSSSRVARSAGPRDRLIGEHGSPRSTDSSARIRSKRAICRRSSWRAGPSSTGRGDVEDGGGGGRAMLDRIIEPMVTRANARANLRV